MDPIEPEMRGNEMGETKTLTLKVRARPWRAWVPKVVAATVPRMMEWGLLSPERAAWWTSWALGRCGVMMRVGRGPWQRLSLAAYCTIYSEGGRVVIEHSFDTPDGEKES